MLRPAAVRLPAGTAALAGPNEYRTTFAPTTYSKVRAEAPILTQTIRINFYPNSANIFEPKHDDIGQPIPNTLYDPSVNATMEKVARLAGLPTPVVERARAGAVLGAIAGAAASAAS